MISEIWLQFQFCNIYNIYRGASRNAVGEKINSTIITLTTFIDEMGYNGLWYWVKSLNSSGNVSDRSLAVQVK